MKTLFFTLVTIVIASLNVFANEGETEKNGSEAYAVISGQVVDENNGEALVGVAVKLNDDETVYTDFDGKFEFKHIKNGKYSIKTGYVAYEEKVIDFTTEHKEEIQIKLKSL